MCIWSFFISTHFSCLTKAPCVILPTMVIVRPTALLYMSHHYKSMRTYTQRVRLRWVFCHRCSTLATHQPACVATPRANSAAVSVAQANGQAAFFVALFRKDTRDTIMQWVQWALPTSIPFVTLQHTPAQLLQSFVDNRIQGFQDGVDKRAAARQADARCSHVTHVQSPNLPAQLSHSPRNMLLLMVVVFQVDPRCKSNSCRTACTPLQ